MEVSPHQSGDRLSHRQGGCKPLWITFGPRADRPAGGSAPRRYDRRTEPNVLNHRSITVTDSTGHYTVLARRFRPQTFAEVVGQERIGQALCNAIQSDRVAHAYLFTGARGVGKTSTARIFAKALNCPHLQDGVPCNECDVCEAISAGSDVDVLEIDGASNRGIDDIRSLRANVNVKSMRSPYKVYIIDEVHMLTKEAFNALLKTLEEPPPRVKFVFCTTEPNKVPDTILSRCQRFDFGTIAADSIRDRLSQIATAEGVAVADEALGLVARRAAGSMRDSQSLFDQLLAFGGDTISADNVHQLLGTASDERLADLFDAIIARRRDAALEILDRSTREGVQIGSLSDQVLHYLRDLMIVAAGANEVALESVGADHRTRLSEQAQTWGLQTITAAMQILAETKGRMQRVNYDRALMELAVIRLSLLEELDDIGSLIVAVRGGSDPPARPSVPRSPQGSVPPPQSPLSPTSPARAPSAGPASGQPTTTQSPAAPPPPSPQLTPTPSALAPTAPARAPSAESASTPSALNGQSAGEVSEQKTVEFAEETLSEFMSEVYTRLGDKVSSHIRRSESIAISGPERLEISFSQSYFLSKQYLEREEILRQLNGVVSQIAGKTIDVILTTAKSKPAPDRGPEPASRPRPSRRKTSELDQDVFVEQAVSIFSGTVVDVREIHDPTVEE